MLTLFAGMSCGRKQELAAYIRVNSRAHPCGGPAKRNGHCDGCIALQFVADNIEDPKFAEDLRIYFNLPRMVPEILLPGRVTRQHFSQWYSCREVSGVQFLFFRMGKLPIMRFISLWLSFSLSKIECGK